MPYLKTEAYQDPSPPPSVLRSLWFVVAATIVVVSVGGLSIWRLKFSRSTVKAAPVTYNEVPRLLDRVGKLILLPSDETPLIGTVTDAQALASDQPFFADARTGDVVVVYERHARALVYRPSRDILINAGPTYAGIVTAASPQAQVGLTSTPILANLNVAPPAVKAVVSPLKLDIRNGSKISGKAAQLAKILSIEKTYYDVVSVVSAARKEYEGITLVVLRDSSSAYLGMLKNELGKTQVTTTLMHGEKSSTADVVIILGN